MSKMAMVLALTVLFPLAISEIAPRAAQASGPEISSRARVFAYCLRGSPKGGGGCSYNTRAQCMASASGRGGHCVRNPSYARARG